MCSNEDPTQPKINKLIKKKFFTRANKTEIFTGIHLVSCLGLAQHASLKFQLKPLRFGTLIAEIYRNWHFLVQVCLEEASRAHTVRKELTEVNRGKNLKALVLS